MKKIPKEQALKLLIGSDIKNANLSIEHACEVMGTLLTTLQNGMNEHQHFDGYIEEYIHQARWVMNKIFDDAYTIQKAIKASGVSVQ